MSTVRSRKLARNKHTMDKTLLAVANVAHSLTGQKILMFLYCLDMNTFISSRLCMRLRKLLELNRWVYCV